MKHSKINVGGIEISSLSFDEMTSIFNNCIEQQEKMRVCVTPVNCLVWASENESLRLLYNTADMVLCDGMPIVWASKILGTPIKQRITGLDVLPSYIENCYQKGYSMFFLGGKEGVADALKTKMEQQYPGIKILGTYSPPMAAKFSEEENIKMRNIINSVKPNILWVSLTAPKQDYWIFDNLKYINTNIAIGVGGAFEVTAGLIKRAPVVMQKTGLEWLYRFLQEPKRLFRRYFVEAPSFFPIIYRQLKTRKSK